MTIEGLEEGWKFTIQIMWTAIAGAFIYTSSVLWFALGIYRDVSAMQAANRQVPQKIEQEMDGLQIAELKKMLSDLNSKVDRLPASEERLRKIEGVLKAYVK